METPQSLVEGLFIAGYDKGYKEGLKSRQGEIDKILEAIENAGYTHINGKLYNQ